jgi:pimeloyl-ACP methyl ester carboxylesterase
MYATWFINEYGDDNDRLRGAILSDPGAFTKKELDEFMDRYIGTVSLTGEQFNDALWSEQFLSADDHARADYLLMSMALRGVPAEHKDQAHLAPIWRLGAVVQASLFRLAEDSGFDWTTHLKAFPHKVLFLRSELDTATTLESQRHMAGYYADAEVVTLPGVGHEMIHEGPAQYLAHTRTYFQAIGFAGVAP